MYVPDPARTDGRVMREATALAAAGFAVSIIDIESAHSHPSEEKIRGICVKHIVMPGWFVSTRFKLWFLIKIARLFISSTLRLILTQADIYHAHNEVALPACYIAARLHRKPLIFDAHELPLSETSVTRWRRLHALTLHLFTHIVPHCAGVITISPPIAQQLYRHYHARNVSLIRNVPEYRTVLKSDRLRQYLGIGPSVRIALYQGNIQSDRGLDKLIRAAGFLGQDVVIVIMGQATKGMVSKLSALIAREEVGDRVKIIPPVPYEELLEWTASADIGLIVYSPSHSPNIQMCLPNKLFEYLMAGLPVLSSHLDAIVDLIEAYDVGRIITSLTPADVGVAISALVADLAALARMRHNALMLAKDSCWEKESQQLIRLYHDILGK